MQKTTRGHGNERTKQLIVRLTEDEMLQLDQSASMLGLSRSEYVRRQCLGDQAMYAAASSAVDSTLQHAQQAITRARSFLAGEGDDG